jgi:nitrate reductase NapD
MNISSAIVHIVPARLDEACAALAAMPGVEIHARSPEGKVVVTIEDDDTESPP